MRTGGEGGSTLLRLFNIMLYECANVSIQNVKKK